MSSVLRGIGVLAGVAGLAAARAEQPSASRPLPGSTANAITEPSDKRIINFNNQIPGIVLEVLVKDGDAVKAGQKVMQLDDEADKLELLRATLEKDSTSRIEYAQAELDINKVKLERATKIFGQGAGSESEVEDARLLVVKSEKSLEIAKDDQKQAEKKAEIQAKKVKDELKLSPIDGVVERVNIHGGEMSDTARQDGAVIIVKNDPLWIEIKELTTAQVAKLKVGDKLRVRYLNDAADAWQDSTVWYLDPAADAASDTQIVKLTMPNPTGRASGLRMEVQLPPELVPPAEKTAEAK